MGSKNIVVDLLKNKYNLFVFLIFIAAVGLWVSVQIVGTKASEVNYIWSLFLGLVPFFAGFTGLAASKKWGGKSSALGRSVGLLALGVLLWGVGELIWSYYNLFKGQAAPYPSAADIAFTFNYFFWVTSAVFLTKLTGVNLLLRKRPKLWIPMVTAVIIGTVISYYLLVVVARDHVVLTDVHNKLKVLLDVYYPLGDFFALTMVIITLTVSGKYLGGKLKPAIITFLSGLVVMYAGDFTFSYTTTKGTFYNGDFGDLILLCGVSLLSLSLILYNNVAPRAIEQDRNPVQEVKTDG